jgi:hypothetical protein
MALVSALPRVSKQTRFPTYRAYTFALSGFHLQLGNPVLWKHYHLFSPSQYRACPRVFPKTLLLLDGSPDFGKFLGSLSYFDPTAAGTESDIASLILLGGLPIMRSRSSVEMFEESFTWFVAQLS